MLKGLGVAIALNNQSVDENVRYDLVVKERDTLLAKITKLEGDLSRAKEEHATAVNANDNELKTLKGQAITDQKTIAELQGKVKDLEAATSDADGRREDERPDLQVLDRAGLIEKLEVVEKAMPKMVCHGFESAVEQVKVVNPEVELVTEGIHFLKSVENGELITPSDFDECVALLAKADVEEDAVEEAAQKDA